MVNWSRELVGAWQITTLQELMRALSEIASVAGEAGAHPSTVYPERACQRLRLVKTTLTDGTALFEIWFSSPLSNFDPADPLAGAGSH